jgi:hypothetical protein
LRFWTARKSFDDHTVLVAQDNVGKSTVFEALELGLGPRPSGVEEFDFYNALCLDETEEPIGAGVSRRLRCFFLLSRIRRGALRPVARPNPFARPIASTRRKD